MKKLLLLFAALCALASCSDDPTTSATPNAKPGYVLLTGNVSAANGPGYLTAYSALPTGSVTNVASTSLQTQGAYGFRTFGKNLFMLNNEANQSGIQKYAAGTDGRIANGGFLSTDDSPNPLVVDETTGFYFDGGRDLLKIQKFNPTTLTRTGDIDLSRLARRSAAYQSIGQHVLATSNGKLYADIHFGTASGRGFLDATADTAFLAVIDIASGRYEKTIKLPGVRGLGYLAANRMWDRADDGTLYLLSLGQFGSGNSKIVRVLPGTTNFDPTWKLDIADYRPGGAFIQLLVRGGKIYTNVPTEALAANFSNLATNIWQYVVIDIATRQSTRVQGVPTSDFNGSTQSLVEADGKVYFLVTTPATNATLPSFNGFFVAPLGSTTATEAFRVSAGGSVQGLAILK